LAGFHQISKGVSDQDMFKEGRKEGGKEGSKQAWKCQGVELVIILYESGLASRAKPD
jgi:hypothetical protein